VNVMNIGGIMRGHFGRALVWTVPPEVPLSARIRVQGKYGNTYHLLVYDTDKGWDPPQSGGQYAGRLIGRGKVQFPAGAGTMTVEHDAARGTIDFLSDGKSLLKQPLLADHTKPLLLVFAVTVREVGEACDSSFTVETGITAGGK
jgi:hypothetical protein